MFARLFGHIPRSPGSRLQRAKTKHLISAAFLLLPFEVLSTGKAIFVRIQIRNRKLVHVELRISKHPQQ